MRTSSILTVLLGAALLAGCGAAQASQPGNATSRFQVQGAQSAPSTTADTPEQGDQPDSQVADKAEPGDTPDAGQANETPDPNDKPEPGDTPDQAGDGGQQGQADGEHQD